jgi:hypothetical protein
MLILEGIRRSGKSFTLDVFEKYFSQPRCFKDFGIRAIKDLNICTDAYAIGRDLAYAQFLPTLPSSVVDNIIFDRQYISSCVYGLYYRNKYNKDFWIEHMKRIENLYSSAGLNITTVFLKLKDSDFHKIASMNRKKDDLEDDNELSYREQYDLYEELLNFSSFPVFELEAFLSEENLIDKLLLLE